MNEVSKYGSLIYYNYDTIMLYGYIELYKTIRVPEVYTGVSSITYRL